MIFGVEGVDPARRRQLVQLLDIDLYQRLTTMSDGQKRRVQIAMGLLKPYDVLLLDEITVDMDVLGEHQQQARDGAGRGGVLCCCDSCPRNPSSDAMAANIAGEGAQTAHAAGLHCRYGCCTDAVAVPAASVFHHAAGVYAWC